MALPDNLADLAKSFLGDASNQSLASPGYQKFPSGLLIQWGTIPSTASGGAATVSPPVAFSSLYTAIATPSTTASAIPNSWGLDNTTTGSSLKFNNHSAITQGGFWVAIGT